MPSASESPTAATGPLVIVAMKSRSSAGWTGQGPVTLTSIEKPSEVAFTVPFTAGAAVNTLKPKTNVVTPKLPVPAPWCVQVTTVPPPDTCAVHSRLVGGSSGDMDVGGVALATPRSPESVIVATFPGAGQTA